MVEGKAFQVAAKWSRIELCGGDEDCMVLWTDSEPQQTTLLTFRKRHVHCDIGGVYKSQPMRNPTQHLPETLRFSVPLLPPSVNHYKKPVRYRTREGYREGFAVTPEGRAFKEAVAIMARGATLVPASITKGQRDKLRYAVFARVCFGPGDRGDGDNYWKCIGDGLKEAGVIHSDDRVTMWVMIKDPDDRKNPNNPRTELRISRLKERP